MALKRKRETTSVNREEINPKTEDTEQFQRKERRKKEKDRERNVPQKNERHQRKERRDRERTEIERKGKQRNNEKTRERKTGRRKRKKGVNFITQSTVTFTAAVSVPKKLTQSCLMTVFPTTHRL